jgi:hypothetical protein
VRNELQGTYAGTLAPQPAYHPVRGGEDVKIKDMIRMNAGKRSSWAKLWMRMGILAFVSWLGAVGGSLARGQEKDSAGLVVSGNASAKEVGLPIYPGAKPHKDKDNDSPSAQVGLWGSSFGFKLAVMKMESGDAPDKIAEFYKKALGKYGKVLNCSQASPESSGKDKSGSSNTLDCGDDKAEPGEMLFKAGTKEKQHIVGIKPSGQGSLFQLVYVEARGDEKDKKAL